MLNTSGNESVKDNSKYNKQKHIYALQATIFILNVSLMMLMILVR